MFQEMNSYWNKSLSVSIESGRLMLEAPEGSDIRFGMRDSLIDAESNPAPDTEFIMCFGGSTTFGHGVSQEDTWPAHLSRILPYSKVLNCGVVKNDLKASLNLLVSMLRLGIRPTQIIFLDGVNESSGYTKWVRGQQDYVDYDSNYLSLNGLLQRNELLKSRSFLILKLFLGELGVKISKIILSKSNRRLMWERFKQPRGRHDVIDQVHLSNFERDRFVNSAAMSYSKTKQTIEKIAKSFGIKHVYFFLQPTFFDTLSDKSSNPRAEYLNSLYKKICELDSDVIDISRNCGILMAQEMYFDWQHSDGRGNAIIAQEIASKLDSSIIRTKKNS